MIIVRLMGGLGNQMFQYATARALALRRETEVRLDLGWYRYEGRNANTPRYPELDCFQLKAEKVTIPQKLVDSWGGRRSRLWKYLLPGFSSFPTLRVVREPGEDMAVNPEVLNSPDNTLLIGFWQSEKYFKESEREIRSDFSFRPTLTGRNLQIAEKIEAVEAVSLHVRRGDYVHDKLHSQSHGALPLDYYERALAHLGEKLDSPEFFVFSDAPDWVEANLRIDYPTTYVNHNQGKNYEDLRLMSLCGHHIIANSSFSWWGAWLGSNPGKIVIAPEQWFRDSKIQVPDLIPEGWIRI